MRRRLSRLRALVIKETRQMRRDPVLLRMLLVTPVLQVLVLGYAATNDVRNVPVVCYDGDRSPDSRLLVELVRNSHYLRLEGVVSDPRDVERLMLRGKAQLGVNIPRYFHRDRLRGSAVIGLYVDGSDSNTSGVAASYLMGILRQQGATWQLQRMTATGEAAFGPGVTGTTRVWFNPELLSSHFMVPGVLGMILLTLAVNTAALAIVREREAGTLEQLMVTPLRPGELILGKLAPLSLLCYVEMLFVLVLAKQWFHLPLTGSIPLLLAASFVFLISALGLGLVISALSRTQQEAQLVSFLMMTPSMLLSGFMFPVQNMPVVIQYVTLVIPFRYYLEIVRGVFLRDAGAGVLWPQMLALTGLSALLLIMGVVLSRKRL